MEKAIHLIEESLVKLQKELNQIVESNAEKKDGEKLSQIFEALYSFDLKNESCSQNDLTNNLLGLAFAVVDARNEKRPTMPDYNEKIASLTIPVYDLFLPFKATDVFIPTKTVRIGVINKTIKSFLRPGEKKNDVANNIDDSTSKEQDQGK